MNKLATQSILEQQITPETVPWLGMQPDKCVPLALQPEDIGWNCHMYSFGLNSNDFDKISWDKLFSDEKYFMNLITFNRLFETRCITNVAGEKQNNSNLVLYVTDRIDPILEQLEVVHSAQIVEEKIYSRMSLNNAPEQIFQHQIGAVQEQYAYGDQLHVVFGKITSDKQKIIDTLQWCLDQYSS